MIAAEAEAGTDQPVPPPGEIVVLGDRAMSMWSYPSTSPDGQAVLVEGVDIWTFDNGRIATKDAYRKSFNDAPR